MDCKTVRIRCFALIRKFYIRGILGEINNVNFISIRQSLTEDNSGISAVFCKDNGIWITHMIKSSNDLECVQRK